MVGKNVQHISFPIATSPFDCWLLSTGAETAVEHTSLPLVVRPMVSVSLAGLADLVFPALVDSRGDDVVEIGLPDATDEEHFDIVLDRDQLGVVDPRLPRELLRGYVNLQGHRLEAQRWFRGEKLWLATGRKHRAVLGRLHTSLGTSSPLVGEDRPKETGKLSDIQGGQGEEGERTRKYSGPRRWPRRRNAGRKRRISLHRKFSFRYPSSSYLGSASHKARTREL